jgi:hypothetical protein
LDERVFGIDLSNYTTNVPVPGSGAAGGLITDALVRCWVESGYTHAIVGTQWPGVARHQLEMCARGGMTLDAYCWLSWSRDVRTAVATALRVIDGFDVRRLWLDCEEASGGRSPAEIVALIGSAVDACGAFPCGIYTARWWWPAATGDSAAFEHLPLWHAEYPFREGYKPDAQEAPAFESFKPYGGWTHPAMWQFAGSVQHCGANVDLNVIEDAVRSVNVIEINPAEGQRVVSNGKQLVFYNQDVMVMALGTPDGACPGRLAVFEGNAEAGGSWYELRRGSDGTARLVRIWSNTGEPVET